MNLTERVEASEDPTQENTSTPGDSLETNDGGGQPQAPETPEVTDLSKLEKFMFEGKETTYEDLRKSHMMQSDYTRKMQALAEDRKEVDSYKEEAKFYDNLDKDLAAVRANPQLAQSFKAIYPEKFHRYLGALGIEGQQVPQQSNAQQGLPSEVLRELEAIKQSQSQFTEFMTQKEKETFDAKIEALEKDLSSEFPRANLTDVYAMAQETFEKENLDPKQLSKEHLKPFFEASHRYQLEQYKAWQKEETEKARSRNSAGSDIGRGGATPGAAPEKIRLKDVYKHMQAEGE